MGMLSVYKNKPFARFSKKARISDADLWKAAQLANKGAIDADLGGGVIKQRIARAGKGKSGGSRSVILFRKGDRAILSTGLRRRTSPISRQTNWRPFESWQRWFLVIRLQRWNG